MKRLYNQPPTGDPWLRLWTAILLRAIYDLQNKSTRPYPDRYEAQELLKSNWVQQMALDINGINLQEMVK